MDQNINKTEYKGPYNILVTDSTNNYGVPEQTKGFVVKSLSTQNDRDKNPFMIKEEDLCELVSIMQ